MPHSPRRVLPKESLLVVYAEAGHFLQAAPLAPDCQSFVVYDRASC